MHPHTTQLPVAYTTINLINAPLCWKDALSCFHHTYHQPPWTELMPGLDWTMLPSHTEAQFPRLNTQHIMEITTQSQSTHQILPNAPPDHLLPSKPDYISHLLIPRGVLSLKLGEWRTQTVASLTCFLELPSRSRVASKLHNTHSVTISKHGNKMYVSSTTISQVIYGNHSTTYQ